MDSSRHIHFIGIGGIGISGLARLYVQEGYEVSGTNDWESPKTLDALREQGVVISLDQSSLPEADTYVYSEAWETMNPELMVKARATGKPVISYFEAVAQVANEYYLIAVSGAHGKTTTTAMLIDVLEEAGMDPSAIVGSLRAKTGSNYRAGKSKYFIVEACEYKAQFLHFNPDVLVITNIEHEHVDYYKDLTAVQEAFHTLARKVPEDGAIIANVSDPSLTPVLDGVSAHIIDYKSHINLTMPMRQPGLHIRMDAAAAFAVAEFLKIENRVAASALQNFAGTMRRFEYKGEVNGAMVYDDYAHHPTEIAVTLKGVRELYPEKKITVVFQPHTYSRTKQLFTDFVSALEKADHVILVPIYASREYDDGTVTSEMLVDALIERGVDAKHLETLGEAASVVKASVGEDDIVLVMGAGDVTDIASILTT